MVLIFGGAYQGKREFAMSKYDLEEKDIYNCETDMTVLDFDKKAFAGFEKFVLACIKEGSNPEKYIRDNIKRFKNKIIICTDISQGIVPMDKTEREWREQTGRCMNYLGQQADEVIRVFCGLGSRVEK